MLPVVTATALTCWLMYFIAQVVHGPTPCSLSFWRLLLAHVKSAINPFSYAIFNQNFRHGYRISLKILLLVSSKLSASQQITSYFVLATVSVPLKWQSKRSVSIFKKANGSSEVHNSWKLLIFEEKELNRRFFFLSILSLLRC